MDKTKAAISNFISGAGHHDTTVHEKVAPHVTRETVKPQRHEEVNTVVDREVHQDHHHKTIQPIHDREVLPEKHHHNVGGVEHRHFDHRDHEQTKKTLASQELQDSHITADTKHTKTNAPIVQGEHVHHHVHETIQPVIHKEVVQPHVVHTTVPIHEVHHNAAQHHSTTQLPAVTMDEYKKHGEHLSGKEHTHAFDGCPKGSHVEGSDQAHSHTNAALGNKNNVNTSSIDHDVGKGKHTKPSLLDRLNPMKDADGDGKKGIMD